MVTEEDSSPPNPANPAELVQSGSPRLSISDSYEPKVADSTKSVPVTSASPINYPTISGDVSTQSVSPAIVTTKRQYDQSSLTVKSLPSKITFFLNGHVTGVYPTQFAELGKRGKISP